MGWENSGDGLLVSGEIPGAQNQAQTFTNGIIATPIYGGTAANDDITIGGTSHATKTTSYVLLQPSGGNVGIGTLTPDSLLHTSVSTANTNTVQQLLTLSANSTGTAAAGFGSRILWELESSTTDDRTAAALDVVWMDATHATRTSLMTFSTVNSAGSLTERMRITGAGNVGIGSVAASYALEVVKAAANSVVYVGTTTSGLAQIMAAGAYSDTNPGFFEARAGASFMLTNYNTTANNYSCISFKDANSYPVAQIAAVNTDHVNHGGYLAFWARPASGTALEVMRATPTEVVVNDTGASTVDFRVEGDTSANLLFVDASVDKIKVGGTAERATTAGTNAIDIFNGTAPVGTLANGISIYSKAGEFYALDAAGNETLNSPHDPETGEWIFWSRNTVTGRTYRVDMERMVAAIEALTGQSFTTETFD